MCRNDDPICVCAKMILTRESPSRSVPNRRKNKHHPSRTISEENHPHDVSDDLPQTISEENTPLNGSNDLPQTISEENTPLNGSKEQTPNPVLRTTSEQKRPSDIPEKVIQTQLKELVHLIENIWKSKNIDQDVETLQAALENNKNLINLQYCKDNKLKSLLHFAKYTRHRLPFSVKQRLVNTIINVGYCCFNFSSHENSTENVHAYFFIAAKGDFDKLREIVEYFKQHDITKIHDTREGDTVLSFMIKFGDYTQERFLNCFSYLIEQKIDLQRMDYYKHNVEKVIEVEKQIFKKDGAPHEVVQAMERITNIVKTASVGGYYEHIKYKLFQYLIEENVRFETLLRDNLSQKDSDDGENTILQLAIIKNNLHVSKLLLQHNADPNRVVQGRNEEFPLTLAVKLNREAIFTEILNHSHIQISEDVFIKIIVDSKPKFVNSLLESNKLNVNYRYHDKTPLFYAIARKNKIAIKQLLQRGARLDENCLSYINPKDLEEYLNSCIRFDSFKDDMEENDYKAFVVFDFFIKSPTTPSQQISLSLANVEDCALEQSSSVFPECESEMYYIENIGSNKRLEYLLEHPLIHMFILLKWQCVLKYYYCFVIFKFILYTTIVFLVYNCSFNPCLLTLLLMIQSAVVYINCIKFKLAYRDYTLHFLLEIIIYLLLGVYLLASVTGSIIDINQVSAFIIIFTSLSFLLTLGYHIDLSKWMSMTKRVFKNFGILLLFFIFPILAFALAFNMLLSNKGGVAPQSPEPNEDFSSIPRSIFRTFLLLSGDIGDKTFSSVGSYLLFLWFSVGMGIILLNFWTGVAVSDIKEIEEQSTIVAFNNVIVFIQGVERIYNLTARRYFKKTCLCLTKFVREKLPEPFLKSKTRLDAKKRSKYQYGIDLYINNEYQFKNGKNCKCFWGVKLDNDVISKIKSLNDDKEFNVKKAFKYLMDKIDNIEKHQKEQEHTLRTLKLLEKQQITN